MAKKVKNTKFQRIITFPERTNNAVLFFIVLLTFGLVIILDACVLPKNDYKHEPEYEEVKYTEYFNPHVRILNNYVYDNEKDEILNKYRVIACYFAYSTQNKIIDYKTDALFVTEDGSFIYKGDSKITETSSYTNTDYLINNATVEGGLIEKIYFKINYTKYQSSQKTDKEYITFKEEVLELSKKELKMDVCNDFSKLTNVLSSLSLNYEVIESEQTIDGKKVTTNNIKLKSSFKKNPTNKNNFHMDLQIFGVTKDNEAYNLMGFYNMGNHASNSFELDTSYTDKLNFEYIIIKCVYEDDTTDGKQTYYMKKAFKDIAKE